MVYSLAAKALALTHLAFVLFVVLGGFIVLRWPRMIWAHLPAAVWGALVEFAGWYCPLTQWENLMLQRAGQAGYSRGFIEHYIFAAIYPHDLTRGIQISVGVFVVLVNVAVYGRAYLRPKRIARG